MSSMNKPVGEENGKRNIGVKLWLFHGVDKLLIDKKSTKKNNSKLVQNTRKKSQVVRISPQAFKFVASLVSILVIKFVGFQLSLFKLPIKRLLKVIKLGSGVLSVLAMVTGLLASGFIISGIIMINILQKPMHKTEILDLDYTKTNPVGCVPISGLANNHNLELTVSLTMPESEYNRQLGVFQVRVEVVSAGGEVAQTRSKASMLEYRSKAIRIMKTVLKIGGVIGGLSSESQTVKIKMKELRVEQHQQQQHIRVMIESRAEFSASSQAQGHGIGNGNGNGIPQIYEASVCLKSRHLSLLHSLSWKWKFTLFIWNSFFFFLVLLFFVFLLFPFPSFKHSSL